MLSSIAAYDACTLCPRACGAARNSGKRGVCGAANQVRIARAALHFWEEPPISGEAGSGAIFFSGCPLKCIFCQNHEISSGNFGQDISVRRLAKIMLELQDQGALNINLVTPSHFTPQIGEAVALAKGAGLALPIVCNTSGYETVQTVQALAQFVDVWLTDFKYASSALAGELSAVADYPQVAEAALKEMLASVRAHGGECIESESDCVDSVQADMGHLGNGSSQADMGHLGNGDAQINANTIKFANSSAIHSNHVPGRMTRGIIVRHLVLPGHVSDSCAVLDKVWQLCGNEVSLSVMNQYTPNDVCRARQDDLAYPLPIDEYEQVLDHADELGFERVYWQEGGAVSESFIPAFDTTGVTGPEL